MASTLLVDLGNQAWKWSVLQEGSGLASVEVAPVLLGEVPPGLLALARESSVRLSSVHPAACKDFLEQLDGIRIAIAGPSGLPTTVASQGTGSDRVLSAWSAFQDAGRACVVADCGTAWTLDFIDESGVFRGGAIGPGLGLCESALQSACPHLPSSSGIEVPTLPMDSAAAVEWGTRGALVATLQALAAKIEDEFSRSTARYLTGGDAARLAPMLGQEWQHVEHLVLRGLALWEPTP